MKTINSSSNRKLAWTSVSSSLLLVAGTMLAQPTPPPAPSVHTQHIFVNGGGTSGPGNDDENDDQAPGGISTTRRVIKIETLDPGTEKDAAREVTWLGIASQEVPEALASQWGLKPGEGLVVNFVAPDSPAAKAGIQKYDVIETLGDQMLVDPVQLRKLVQMQQDGDSISLTLHRGGKKQTVSATLAKRTERLAWSEAAGMGGELPGLAPGARSFDWVLENQKAPTAFGGKDKQRLNIEVQRNIEEARQAIQEALRQSDHARLAAPPALPALPGRPVPPKTPAAPETVDVDKNATVTVTQDDRSVKTIVKSDETGSLILMASPKKHLTAHDADGKLIFDGEIETKEQQQKVPAALWEKVKPMLPKIKPTERAAPEPQAQSQSAQKI